MLTNAEVFKMPITRHNPSELFPPYRNYSHAVEVSGDSRILFISGLNGYLPDGKTMPESFEEQGTIIWEYIGTILRSAGMGYEHIVSLRTYLASPEYDEANVQLRMQYLGANEPASTVLCCQLLESKWKLEIEAVAAM
ncbi:MAG: hypothetical protein GFH27_549325n58 [Chloroflexi bacterium AL-W]|nr:hypothetical protein [Chloroflexi bacterium AL-N1]NOK70092.1 hypothetical protein [Chloroflexi bacterium AL-N10]NOK77896.1 hypothetical protein [Chloroflexi bacterium AL-N5]NOK84905.1 hypothetical protein [Chloroflexi bacterium AL-W]NOK91884.1 hypothetical protein [Chloroflexi bacterium AL-N15]